MCSTFKAFKKNAFAAMQPRKSFAELTWKFRVEYFLSVRVRCLLL